MNLKEKFGKNLQRLVAERRMSLEKFAYETGISKGYIYDMAQGKANVSLTMLEKIAKGLKIKPQDLLA